MMPSSSPHSIRTETFTKTNTDELILQDTSLDYRVLNFATSTFDDNNTSYWHKSVGGYHPAKLRRYQEMIEHHISPEMQRPTRPLPPPEVRWTAWMPISSAY